MGRIAWTILLVLAVASPLYAQMSADPTGAAPGSRPEEKRWSSFLPLMAAEATKHGYQLPLPFGVSTVFLGLLSRRIDVTDVRVGVSGVAPQSVSRFVDLGSTTDVFNANLKVDARLRPLSPRSVHLGRAKMSDIQDLLARQARWQKRRQALSWPEKIQLALKMRQSIGMLRGRREPAPAKPADFSKDGKLTSPRN